MNEKFKRDHEYRRNIQHREQESWSEAVLTLVVMIMGAAACMALLLVLS